MNFTEDFNRSVSDSQKFVLPVLRHMLGEGATVIQTEGRDDALSKTLDFACVDGIAVSEYGVVPYASRVSYGKCYKTFTLRDERPNGALTEVTKIRTARDYDLLKPSLHLQAYVDEDGTSATVARVWTQDLFNYVDLHVGTIETKTVQLTGEKFLVVPWSKPDSVRVFRVTEDGGVVAEIFGIEVN